MKISYLSCVLLAASCFAPAGTLPKQTVGQDAKDAGQKTTSAVKKGAVKTKNGVTKGATAAGHGVKKGAHAAAAETEKGADKVKDKTTSTSK